MGHTFISKDGDKSNERPTHPPVSASAVFWSGVCQHNTETLGSANQDIISLCNIGGFPGGSAGKESICNAGDQGSIPGWGRFPGGGHSNPLQYSCLENPTDRGAWRATVHGVAESDTTVTLRVFPGFSKAVRRLCSIPTGRLQKRTEGLERGRE